MKVGKSYKQHPITGRYDGLVISSGIGALAAAAILSRHGDKLVLLLERDYAAGGFTHTFHRPGYEWDVGVRYSSRRWETIAPPDTIDSKCDGSWPLTNRSRKRCRYSSSPTKFLHKVRASVVVLFGVPLVRPPVFWRPFLKLVLVFGIRVHYASILGVTQVRLAAAAYAAQPSVAPF